MRRALFGVITGIAYVADCASAAGATGPNPIAGSSDGSFTTLRPGAGSRCSQGRSGTPSTPSTT